MSDPRRASSVWTQLPFMHGPKGAERLREWMKIQAEVKRQCAERRTRVLAHDWARRQLCKIFDYTNAEKWNGYVPPARNSDGDINASPYRRALVQLLRDVEHFEQTGEVAAADGTDPIDQAGA